jgi:hypothetical protein
MFDITKRYNLNDNQLEALVEVIQVLEILTPDIEKTIDD